MKSEEIERLARYATDSYFSNLSPDAKALVMSDRAGYMSDYANAFRIALEEISKSIESKNREEELRSQFK